jgi:hypothetical protein
MEPLSPEVLATVVAAEVAEAYQPAITEAIRDDLAARIETVLRRMARQERDACIALCRQRHAMWESTEGRSTISEPLRQESRSRANEAAVIADALADITR